MREIDFSPPPCAFGTAWGPAILYWGPSQCFTKPLALFHWVLGNGTMGPRQCSHGPRAMLYWVHKMCHWAPDSASGTRVVQIEMLTRLLTSLIGARIQSVKLTLLSFAEGP